MSTTLDAHAIEADLVMLRHELHRYPEVGLDLPRTQARVLAALEGLPLEITLGTGCSSIAAVLRGTSQASASPQPSSRPTVLLRADMDALPVQEQTGVAYSSRIDGAMHACGHDLHTAMLVGAARVLSAHRDRLDGDVVFMFQPGEEGFDGASVMIDEGILDVSGRRIDAAYGMHVFSALEPHARFSTKPGIMMAASDGLKVTVHGEGGHGSAPHLAKDPVVAVAEMVTALQVMVARQFDAFDPVVVTVGLLQAGTKRNIIPDSAYFEATIRSFSLVSQVTLQSAVPRLLKGIASAHGLDVTVEYITEYPPTVNDVSEAEIVEGIVTDVFGAERYSRLAKPMAASEDFSRILEAVPGAFIGLGAIPVGGDPRTAAFNHSPFATFDDSVLADGATLFAEIADRRLAQLLTRAPADLASANLPPANLPPANLPPA
ncbi:M20 family metallopeptidase [Leifsonia sp. YAF41]|uniref:M20 metallopeptidase family protein n=1 Tax=Leifsonia sp. YAF41 TaxID=3233086 RepID=UPI003F9806F2